MEMIENWKQAWRMLSVQLMGLAATLHLVWAELPLETQQTLLQGLSPQTVHWVTAGLMVCGIVGRLVKQPKLHE